MARVLIQHDEAETPTHLSITALSRNSKQQGPSKTVKAGRSESIEVPEGGRLIIKEHQGQVKR